MLKCPRCGTNNAPSNASCIACGAALGAAPPPGAYGGYPQGYPGAAPPGAPGGAMPPGGGFGPPGAPQHGAPPHGAPQHGAPPGAPGGYAPPGGGYPGAGYPGQQQHTPSGYGAPDAGYGHPHHPGAPQTPPGAPGGMQQPGMGQPGMQQPGMQHPGAGMPPGAPHAGMQNPGTAPTAPGLGGANQGKLAGFLLSYDIEPRGSFWPLRVGSNRIGRKGAADPLDVAIDHPTVSSNHALLNVEAEGAMAQVEDSQSANGTLLHEKSIAGQGRRELRDGDQLRFGAVNVIVKLINPA